MLSVLDESCKINSYFRFKIRIWMDSASNSLA